MTIKQADCFSSIHVAMPACYDAYGNVSPVSVRLSERRGLKCNRIQVGNKMRKSLS